MTGGLEFFRICDILYVRAGEIEGSEYPISP